jgi:SAM-dependent methyltransferase
MLYAVFRLLNAMSSHKYRSDLPLKAAERHKLRRRSFDAVAHLYDRTRPGYPEPLFDDIVRLSGIPEGGRILEIGPGTGQATLPLARRDFSVLGLELGASMARVCRSNCREFPNVEIRNTTFENWEVEPEAFDVVLAATAFHWIPHRVAYPSCARTLKPAGSLALLWNFVDICETGFYKELQDVYNRIVPRMRLSLPPELRIERQRKKIVGSGLFGPVTVLRYPWQNEYTADRYIGLLKTMSDHAILAPQVRRDLFRAIRRLIADNGGTFIRPVVAALFLAPKRAQR